MVYSITKKNAEDFQDMNPDVSLDASRLRSHFAGLSSNFENMAPQAVLEIARHLVEYRGRKARSCITEPSGAADL